MLQSCVMECEDLAVGQKGHCPWQRTHPRKPHASTFLRRL